MNRCRTCRWWSRRGGLEPLGACTLSTSLVAHEDSYCDDQAQRIDPPPQPPTPLLTYSPPETLAENLQRLVDENPDHPDLQTFADNVKKAQES